MTVTIYTYAQISYLKGKGISTFISVHCSTLRNKMLPAQSGAKDAIGKKFNASWKVIFFGCGCTVVFGALLGLWELLMDIIVSPFDIIVLSYLLTFGLIMLVLDSPVPHPKLEIFKLVTFVEIRISINCLY